MLSFVIVFNLRVRRERLFFQQIPLRKKRKAMITKLRDVNFVNFVIILDLRRERVFFQQILLHKKRKVMIASYEMSTSRILPSFSTQDMEIFFLTRNFHNIRR